MSDNGRGTIHGKEYITVARRVELARQNKVFDSVETKVISHNPIVIFAKVTIEGKTCTGISSVNPQNAGIIEKGNPYEVLKYLLMDDRLALLDLVLLRELLALMKWCGQPL